MSTCSKHPLEYAGKNPPALPPPNPLVKILLQLVRCNHCKGGGCMKGCCSSCSGCCKPCKGPTDDCTGLPQFSKHGG